MRMPVVQSNPALLFPHHEPRDQRSSNTGNTITHTTTTSTTRVLVHPLAILHILDHHSRRQEGSGGRVIGTLLGTVVRGGGVGGDGGHHATSNSTTASSSSASDVVVEITNCFAVPHAERGDEVAIGKDFNKKMLALHMRSSKEVVVGWYASASSDNDTNASDNTNNNNNTNDGLVTDTSSLIHEFYAGECDDTDPVHLVVDTRLIHNTNNNNCLQIKAFRFAPLIVQAEHVGNLFHELQLTLHNNEAETICLNQMIQHSSTTSSSTSTGSSSDIMGATGGAEPTSDVSGLQVSLEQLMELLDSTLTFVDSVVDGTVAPDAAKGRQIADTLATVPRLRPEIFDQLFHNSLQDLLMVTYLSNLTRTQLELAEKLNATLGTA